MRFHVYYPLQVSTYRTQSEGLAERLGTAQDHLLELQKTVESRDENARFLVQKVADQETEHRVVKQEAQFQTKELTEQIQMLQEQLVKVNKAAKEPQCEPSQHKSTFIFASSH